ncbi:MAG TPA: hypothetical protein VMV92_05100 [Streptosporangiaceae bacterium]|nr:hypothetical protein [Streptosporangiaceae bacterium]
MTGLAWLNVPLITVVFLAIVGIPLWLTFKRPESHPDYGEARAHFAAKARRAHIAAVAAERPVSDGLTTARQHAAAQVPVPGRRHSGSRQGTRTHAPAPAVGRQPRASA